MQSGYSIFLGRGTRLGQVGRKRLSNGALGRKLQRWRAPASRPGTVADRCRIFLPCTRPCTQRPRQRPRSDCKEGNRVPRFPATRGRLLIPPASAPLSFEGAPRIPARVTCTRPNPHRPSKSPPQRKGICYSCRRSSRIA